MGSVWKEQVERSLIEEIYSSVRIKNENGELIPLSNKSKQVLIRKPEEAFKPEKFPCISIYNKGDAFAPTRYESGNEKLKKRLTDGSYVLENRAVPFNLTYQIDFWSKYQSDMNDLTMTWLMHHFRQFNLLVNDTEGKEISINCIKNGTIVKSDLMQGGERLFHSILTYTIWVEIKDETQYNVDVVEKVVIDVSQEKGRNENV